MSIPIIDLSDPDISDLARQVKDACVNWGFMYLKNHGVRNPTIDRLFEISKEFFHETPLEEKQAYPRGGLSHGTIGYTGQFTERSDVVKQQRGDLKETFNMTLFGDPNYKPDLPQIIMKRWDEIKIFQQECYKLEIKVLVLFAVALGLPQDYFSKFHTALEDTMRFTCYTPPSFPLLSNDMGAGAHSDFGSLTLLFQDDVGGLQVLSNGEWIDATPIPDTILVNVADAMQFWTSNVLKSTKHRVQVPKKQRYSLVYFVIADPDTPLKPIYDSNDAGTAMTAKEHLQMQIDIVMGFRPPPDAAAA